MTLAPAQSERAALGSSGRMRIRALLLEDCPDDAEQTLRELERQGFDVDWKRVDSESAFAAELNSELDVILSDYNLPQYNGVEALHRVKSADLDVPVIIITGAVGEDVAVDAMRLGAADYLFKDNLRRLGESVRQAIEARRMRSQAQESQRALRESEARFRQMADCAPVMIWQTDADNLGSYFSAGWRRFTGRTLEEELATEPRQRVHPDDWDRYISVTASASETRSDFDIEYRMLRSDGTYRWILDHAVPRFLDDGTFEGYIGICTDITNRMQAEESLRHFVRSANCLMWSATVTRQSKGDFAWVVDAVDQATAERFLPLSYQPGERWSEAWYRSKHPDDTAHMDQMAIDALENGVDGYRQSFRCTDANGALRWLYEDVRITSTGPESWSVVGLCTDVTDTRREQTLNGAYAAALEQIARGATAEEVLGGLITTVESLYPGLMCGVWLLDESRTVLRATVAPNLPEGYKQFVDGVAIGDGVGSSGTAVFRRERVIVEDIATSNLWTGYAETALQFGLAACWAEPIVSGEGDVYGAFAFYYTTPHKPEPAEERLVAAAARIAGIAMDRIRSAEALRNSEERFRCLIERSSDIIAIYDEEGTVKYISPAIEAVLGYKPEEVIGGNGFDNVVFDDIERGTDVFDTLLQDGAGHSTLQCRALAKDGSIRYMDVVFTPLLHHPGIQGVVANIRDITEQSLAAEALSEQAQQLAYSNAELEQFAYVASHDLQEPLRMVSSYTQLLSRRYKGRLDSDADEFIGFAVDGVTRMQRLIQDLLKYARVGTQAAEFRSVAMDAIVDAALKNLEVALSECGAEVTSDPLPVVHGDDGQLLQLMQNLIGNAIKFRGEEAPKVHIAAERSAGQWQFQVRDNGIGIEPQYAERIFVIFQRLQGRDQYPGTGIGLAICKKIVMRHGGQIWVESGAGAGSTFRFTLNAGTEGEPDGA
ncbi:MAG: PAS domain S-box protein [Armatimonadetes bacterium]|nr:PAS domain S-box protein [Armatimonadota bacterium]MDE2206339.1 PAS domain S-box protein [Armatimonadota bacterium]